MIQPDSTLDDRDQALLDLLNALAERDYAFVTPTNAAIRRVHRKPPPEAPGLRDIFGWSLPFDAARLEAPILDLMRRADILRQGEGGWRSALRVSSLARGLYLHSAFPTDADDAVFLGPDTYRFAEFIACELQTGLPGGVLADIGAGPGTGGLYAAGLKSFGQVILTDTNPEALRLARIAARFAGVACETRLGEGLAPVTEPITLAVANPPFIAGKDGHVYEDGGGLHGGAVSLDWARQAMAKLAPGGRMLLYTGAAIVDGRDELKAALRDAAGQAGCEMRYRELDPDIFPDELDEPAYAQVERIAAVGVSLAKPMGPRG
jgi:hypothetical protein